MNKPFKSRYRQLWREWLYSQDMHANVIVEPTRNMASKWAVDAFEEITPQIVRNSWMKTDFEFFERETTGEEDSGSDDSEWNSENGEEISADDDFMNFIQEESSDDDSDEESSDDSDDSRSIDL